MTLDELILKLQTWRDLKKEPDAKVLLFDHGTQTWLDIEQVTFGANGAVYVESEKPTFDMAAFAAFEALAALRERVEARQSGVDLMADDGSSSASIASAELDAVVEMIEEAFKPLLPAGESNHSPG